MLVPKGNEAGAKYVLFVMLSNYERDRVRVLLVGSTILDTINRCQAGGTKYQRRGRPGTKRT